MAIHAPGEERPEGLVRPGPLPRDWNDLETENREDEGRDPFPAAGHNLAPLSGKSSDFNTRREPSLRPQRDAAVGLHTARVHQPEA